MDGLGKASCASGAGGSSCVLEVRQSNTDPLDDLIVLDVVTGIEFRRLSDLDEEDDAGEDLQGSRCFRMRSPKYCTAVLKTPPRFSMSISWHSTTLNAPINL